MIVILKKQEKLENPTGTICWGDEHPVHSNEISYSGIGSVNKYDFYLKDRDIRARQTKLR